MNCRECDLVGEIMFSDDAPRTHQAILEISRNTGIHQSSVGCNIYDRIRATYLEEKNMPIWLLKYSGSVATHLR